MASEVETYQSATAALQQHETNLRQTLGTIQSFANAAANNGWQRIVVEGVAMPAELRPPPSFNPTGWPTGESIGRLLAEWHIVKSRKQAAWDRIPQAQRAGLIPPT